MQRKMLLNSIQKKEYSLEDIYPNLAEIKATHSNSLTYSFYCGNFDSERTDCCFNHKIGLPVKNGETKDIFDYELNLLNTLTSKKLLFIKKSTGLGISEFMLRWICYNAETNPNWKNSQVCIVTAPRLELALTLIDRIRRWFPTDSRTTRVIINGVHIEAYPSHNLDAMRGLANPKCIFLDEADFFPARQQKEALAIAERYLAKSNPHIVLVSTPNMPNGLFEKIEKDNNSIYEKIFLPYTVGLGKIFSEKEIEQAKLSESFEREYNLRYGMNDGNMFNNQMVDKCTQEYDLKFLTGKRILAIDPAYSSSKFAIIGIEKVDGIAYVKMAETFEFASPTAMTERIVLLSKDYPTVFVDSAGAGLITDLKLKGVNPTAISFAKHLDEMTLNASRMVKELNVRIHPTFSDLLADLKAVRYNEKGHPDKKQISFDLGDAFLMALFGLKEAKGVSGLLMNDD